jgi:RNase P subunit RPR2
MVTLYRAFSVGRFKCSRIVPKISVAEYLTDGYALVIAKDSTRMFCLGCVKKFTLGKGFRVTEDEKYLTVYAP